MITNQPRAELPPRNGPPPPPSTLVRAAASPPPLPARPIRRGLPWLILAPAACLVLAGLSVAAGALLLPRLISPRAGANDLASAPSPSAATGEGESRLVRLAPSPAVRPESSAPVRTGPAASAFVVPATPPQLPGEDGPFALSRLIDQQTDAKLRQANLPASPLSGDAEFVRRVHLDLIGQIPSRERAAAFLADTSPLKRSKLIDELLGRPEFGRHLARLWADALIKRDFDNNRGLSTAAFTTWLAGRFNDDTGWDQTVRDMVTASGPQQTPETFFILAHQDNRQISPGKLVGSIGNLFMGIQIQCAECHKHPFNDRWGMDDFWGMAAFFGHTRAQRAVALKGKKGIGPATIVEIEQQTAPRGKKAAAGGSAIKAGLVIAVPDPNDPRKVVRTARGKFFESNQPPPAGKAPYRPAFATWLTSSENAYFAPAAVNRLWAHFFARGLVHPIEEMGDKNPASHPELLRTLAGNFASSRFSVKYLIRAVCNSQTYQRTSRPVPENAADDRWLSHMAVKVMDAQQLIDSLAVATGKSQRGGSLPLLRRGPRDAGDALVRALDTRAYDDDATEFTYGIPQLLRLMNTQLTLASAQRAGQLAARTPEDQARALDDIYLTALARQPSVAERERLLRYICQQPEPHKGYAAVFWALLNSAEFISNH